MAEYNIQVKIDPTPAKAGGAAVESTLQGIETQAASAQNAINRAVEFNTGPGITQARNLSGAIDTVTASANNATGAVRNTAGQIGILSASSIQGANSMRDINARLVQMGLATGQATSAGRAYVISAGQQRQATLQLGAQFQDFTQQVTLGINPVTAFTQQAGQAAFALSNMGGAAGTVGRFLAGPWGTLVLVGASILGGFVSQMISTKSETDNAKDALEAFAQKEADLANFIDRTTGKLIQQAGALALVARNAKLAEIATTQKTAADSAQAAFDAAGKYATTGRVSFREGTEGVTHPGDPDVDRAIAKAAGNVSILSTELTRLARTSRPDLAALASNVTNLGGAALTSEARVKSLHGEVQDLNTALRGGVVQTQAMVDRQVALATATNGLERAQAKLADVRASGARIDQLHGTERAAAAKQYLADLTAAETGVKREQQAIKDRRAASAAERKEEAAARAAAKKDERIAEVFALFAAEQKLAELYGVERTIREKQLQIERQIHRDLTPGEKARIEAQVRANDAQAQETKILEGLRKPLDDYADQVAALTRLLAKGKITQDEFNASMADLPLAVATRQVERGLTNTLTGYQAQVDDVIKRAEDAKRLVDQAVKAGLRTPQQGATIKRDIDRQSGREGQDIEDQARAPLIALDRETKDPRIQRRGEIAAINQQFGQRRVLLKKLRDQELITEKEYQRRRVEIAKDAEDQITEVSRARTQMRIEAAQGGADALLQVAEDYAGKQSAIYKAIFVVDKAFAIAQSVLAIQQNIAQASKYGFPENIPFIAAAITQGASILANIRAISLQFADGGFVNGQGGPREDNILARLSAGEFVVNAAATARNRSVLESINSGGTGGGGTFAAPVAADGGVSGKRPVNFTIHNYTGHPVETRQITDDHIEVIAGRVVDRRAPQAVARDMTNRNGQVQKALRRHTTARPETV